MKSKKLERLGKLSKKLWDELAEKDAEFFILTEKSKREGRWGKKEFLETGREQWKRFKELLTHYGLAYIISKKNIALDMGCGVGRITFAMAEDFYKVIGIDVSEKMIQKAQEYQKYAGIKNVEFKINNGVDLSVMKSSSVDFLLSYLTLQHCPRPIQVLNYIKEFARVLKSGGVCVFQTRVSPAFKRYLRFLLLKEIARIKRSIIKDYHLQNAFMGNWVYYPKIYKVVSENFSYFYLLHTPIELYKERFWKLSNEYERWKRSFWLCIK